MKQLILILVSLITFNIHAQHVVDSALNANSIYVDTTGMNIPDSSDFANVVYIDPDAATNGDGSLGSPYNTWPTLATNTAHLQKRGTTASTTSVDVSTSNILIGAYGEGEPPVVNFSGSIRLQSSGNVFRDIVTNSKIQLGSYGTDAQNCYVYNCVLNGQGSIDINLVNWGSYNTVVATKIHNSQTEGIFAQGNSGGGVGNEYAYNHIHDVNQNWFPGATQVEAGGDGLQVSTADDMHIHHNIIDKSSAGNKFCIIIRDEGGIYSGTTFSALIERNILIMPKSTSQGGAGIYMEENQNTVIRNNIIKYITGDVCELYAIYSSQNETVEIYGNLVLNAGNDIQTPNGAIKSYNNTFYNVKATRAGDWSYCENNLLSQSPTGVSSSNLLIDTEGASNLFIDASGGNYRLKTGSPAIGVGIWDAANMSSSYTLDLDSSNVPQNSSIDVGAYQLGTYTLTWCDENQITQSATIGNDTVSRSPATGYIDVTASGANDNFTYSWSSGQSTEDISNIEAGTYSLTITDIDSSCTSIASYSVSDIDTTSVPTGGGSETSLSDTLAHFLFTGNWLDSSLYSNNLTNSGTAILGYDRDSTADNRAAWFKFGSGLATLDNEIVLTDNWTFELWIYSTTTFSKLLADSLNFNEIRFNSSNINLKIADETHTLGGSELNVNEWHKITLTAHNDTIIYNVDNTEAERQAYISTDLRVKYLGDNPNGSAGLNGLVDDVVIYKESDPVDTTQDNEYGIIDGFIIPGWSVTW